MRFIQTFSLIVAVLFANRSVVLAEDHGDSHNDDTHLVESIEHAAHDLEDEIHENEEKFDPATMIMHHISDANEFHIVGDISLPLPIILWEKGAGLKTFLSSSFHHGHTAIDGYVMDHGVIKKVIGDFPEGKHEVEVHHGDVVLDGMHYETEGKHTLLESSSFYDFSITKNVFTMLFAIAILLVVFISMARFYKKGNKVPKGLYSLLEPIVLFVKDDIAIPNIGEKKYAKFMPYLLTVFFFIWLSNLLGLIPFFPGSANLTGNIAVTLVLAVFTMILTNINGNAAYWGHIFNPPVPGALKPLMIPIELIGVITKPFALMIRLFANISAGHILILSLLSLIFIFQSYLVSPVSVGFVLFMFFLELLVAALQAYIFTLLSALFIGLALEEHH